MSLVSFKQGVKANLPAASSSVNGALYLTTDTGELFAANNSAYTKVSDIVICATINDLPIVGSEISTKLYYVTATNSLYKVKNGSWTALGSDLFPTYTSGTGISITSANVINHSNSITAGTSPASSGALSPGDTLTIPQFTYDAQGHVTAVTSSQCTLPAGAGQGSVTSVAAGAGLTTASGSAISTSGTMKAKVTNETPLDIDAVTAASAGTTNRLYPVQIDHSGYLAVNVPWEANTNSITSINGQSSGAITLGAADVGAVASTVVGTANGVAELDSTGKVPSAQLPSFVDDVIEGYYNTTDHKFYEESSYTTEITPESGKIYIDLSTDATYRWGGSAYVAIGSSLALGETSTTAYRGDRGKSAYDHASDVSKLTTAQSSGLYKIATTAEGHIADVTSVQASDITALGIPAQDTTYSVATTTAAGLMPVLDGVSSTKYLKGDGTWDTPPDNNDNTIPAIYCDTAAGTAAKIGQCTGFALLANSYCYMTLSVGNTYAGALTLNVNSTGAVPIYINNEISSSTNYTLPAGTYIGFYDGLSFDFHTNGTIPGAAGAISGITSSPTTVTQTVAASAYLTNYLSAEQAVFTLDTSNWSSTTTTVNSIEYYTYTVSVTAILIAHPIMYLSIDSLPTDAQEEAWAGLKMLADTSNTQLVFYSESVPTVNLSVGVKGVVPTPPSS